MVIQSPRFTTRPLSGGQDVEFPGQMALGRPRPQLCHTEGGLHRWLCGPGEL